MVVVCLQVRRICITYEFIMFLSLQTIDTILVVINTRYKKSRATFLAGAWLLTNIIVKKR